MSQCSLPGKGAYLTMESAGKEVYHQVYEQGEQVKIRSNLYDSFHGVHL